MTHDRIVAIFLMLPCVLAVMSLVSFLIAKGPLPIKIMGLLLILPCLFMLYAVLCVIWTGNILDNRVPL